MLLFLVAINLLAVDVNALGISAETAVLVEASSGKILFSEECEKRMKPASTTKILTALTALNNCKLDEIVSISQNSADTEGSSIYAETGEKYVMKDLIRGLMMNSGNDAAVAIAEHISGSEKKFAELMNKTASECGAKNSNFVNPSGLDHANHYTTAYDLALITKKALENEYFREVVKTKTDVIETTDGTKKYLKNHNRLLSEYQDCDGVKTGFTKASGRTLVSTAERDGMRLIAVTMNAPDDWNDHKNLLNYGFSEYAVHIPFDVSKPCCKAYVKYGVSSYVNLKYESLSSYVVKKGREGEFTSEYLLGEITAPIKKGDVLGTAVIKYDGNEISRVNLVSSENIEKVVIKKSFGEFISMFFQLFSDNHIL